MNQSEKMSSRFTVSSLLHQHHINTTVVVLKDPAKDKGEGGGGVVLYHINGQVSWYQLTPLLLNIMDVLMVYMVIIITTHLEKPKTGGAGTC